MNPASSEPEHVPVLAEEVIEYLRPVPGQAFLDATVGAGGHASRLLGRLLPDGLLIGSDRDQLALQVAKEVLAPFGNAVCLVHARLDRLSETLASVGVSAIDGVLVDLGVSSMQLNQRERGFSFLQRGPLDMRMDQSSGRTAAEWIARAGEEELAQAFYQYGEERWSRRIARRIVEGRSSRPLVETTDLAELVSGAVPRGAWPRGIHPATRVFQAVRIVINEELSQIEAGINQAVAALRPGGRIAVISFHSLEDRIVKQSFVRLAGACICPPRLPVCRCGAMAVIKTITRKPVVPSPIEIARNPRARSAKLRVAERL